MGSIFEEDVRNLAKDNRIPWGDLDGSCVVVTGATGLLGGLAAHALAARGGIRVVLPVRNVEKAKRRFLDAANVKIVAWDASTGAVPEVSDCAYILHCASNTDSRLMVEQPVDTISTTVRGTEAMLELARITHARLCFASSMEVYGAGAAGVLTEHDGGALDAMSVRSSYPQAKQLAETLCAAYAGQYGVAACVARLAQSFGPGIASTDRRVFAEFARCCREGRNIALLTDGSKSNMYTYTADAVRALLLLVCKGAPGEAYNVANPQTFCSIYEMAQMVVQAFGQDVEVTRVVDEQAARRYAVSGRIYMDTAKVEALGWQPDYDLVDMYARMMADWDEQ